MITWQPDSITKTQGSEFEFFRGQGKTLTKIPPTAANPSHLKSGFFFIPMDILLGNLNIAMEKWILIKNGWGVPLKIGFLKALFRCFYILPFFGVINVFFGNQCSNGFLLKMGYFGPAVLVYLKNVLVLRHTLDKARSNFRLSVI